METILPLYRVLEYHNDLLLSKRIPQLQCAYPNTLNLPIFSIYKLLIDPHAYKLTYVFSDQSRLPVLVSLALVVSNSTVIAFGTTAWKQEFTGLAGPEGISWVIRLQKFQ